MIKYKRGTVKAFREFLNTMSLSGPLHRNGAYHQKTRLYGDYLYAQDRDKFFYDLEDAMQGLIAGFDPAPYKVGDHNENVN